MRFLGTSILPRVLFLVTLFGVSSGAAYFWIRSSQEQIVENQRLATFAPSPGSSISPLSEVQRGERSDAQAPNPSPKPTPATDTTIPSLFSQLSSGINTVAQMVVSGSSSLTYQGGTSDSGSINANKLQGSDWSSPAAIGGGTANTAVFSDVTSTGTLAAKGPVTMSQFTNGFLIANGIGEVSATRVSLSNSSHVADRLPTASGGTGNDFSGSAIGSVLSFSATGQMTTVAPGTAGYVLTSNGAGALPTWSSPGSTSVDWNNPGTIGGTTPNTGSFTQLSAAGASTPLNVGSSSQLQVDNNGRMTITYVGDSGSLSSSGGALFFNQTNNTGTGIGIYSNAGVEALGNMINVKVDNPLYSQAAFYMNYDGNSNAVEIVSNADDASSNALAVTGNNIEDSTVGIIGYELARGTVKISHYRPGSGNDSSASGISIDLKGSGTRAQGLYVDSTESGGTLGNLLRLRNESVDKFVVNYQGNLAMAGNLTQGAAGTDTTYTKQGNNSNDQFFVGTTGAFRVQRSAANSEAFRVQVAGDAQGRWLGTSDGQLKWGPGSATQDVVLKRSVAGVLTLDGVIVMNNSNQALDTVVKGSGDDNLLHVDASTDRIGMGLSAPLAALHISKNTGTLPSLILNNSGSGDLLTASASGATRFTIANNGDVVMNGALRVGGTTTLNSLTYTWPAALTNGYVLSTNGSGTLSWVDPTTFAGTNYWQRNSGVVSPATLTDQLALGTITPLANSALHVQRNSTNNALAVFNQTGTSDILTASSSGTTRFTLAENGNITALGNITQGVNGTNTTFMKNGNTIGDEFFVGTTGAFRVSRSAAGSEAFRTQVNGDSEGRLLGTSDGQLKWGSGSLTQDVVLRRGGAGVLFLDGAMVINNLNAAVDTVVKGSLENNLLYVNGNTDRVGIGLSSPVAALHISKNTGTLPSLILNNTGTGDLLTASASGTTRLVVTNAGSVGIGTSSPGYRLTVSGGSTSLASSNWLYFGNAATLYGDGTSTTLDAPNASGALTFNTAGTARARISSTGLFGIGTTSPQGRLDVQGGNGGNPSLIINQTLSGPILTASSSGTTRFTIANTGAITALGDITQGANGSNTSFTKLGNAAGDEFFIGTNGAGRFQRAGSNSETLRMQVSGDTQGRLVVTSDGKLNWGAGNAAQDLTLRRSGAGVLTIDGSLIPGTDATYNLGSTAAKWANIYTGNAGVGATSFGTSAANVLAIANSTEPSASITDGIQLYAVDVTGSHELRVRDEAGNVTTLSPHNFSLVPGGRSEALAWSFYSERNGLAINADMTKALRILEDVSGEQLVFLKDLNTGDNVQVFQRDGSLADRVSQNQEVLSGFTDGVQVEESGWSFLKAVVFQAQARFDQVVEFARQVRFQADAIFEQAVVFQGRIRVNQDTAGVFTVPAGATKVRISFHQAFSKTPLVSLSAPQGLSGSYLLEEVAKDGFVVSLSQAQLKDLTLQWWAVESEAGQAAMQVLEGAVLGESSVDASPTPAASPAPSVQPSIQPSILPSATPSPTPLSTPSPTPSPSVAPSPEVSPSPEPSVIPNASSPVPTPSPSSQP